ncbi:D-xylose ABC transporter ATP-binding protein [Bacillus canaveralius]|uniref:D-xylose ABC transporter ATP-binding protein n=1 Tax=Bacillus canaveralius TaxID=1403243 RepID=A0A2N5GSI4_9BACI|nr:sugar ABC transporter ATP-binding protein [Bacillus canaveralius]PLR86723.1 D-xylose ABC transporter ATP-binding protein [Bacillus canaveralius]PLR92815.1 D-xylose ABC transporter ATP-binding protein [Bacillus canaveralius]
MQSDILVMEEIEKSFPGVKALQKVHLSVRKGEVHALLGENGAGKSTLMKILAGAYSKDAGKIFFDSEAVEIKNPKHAQEMGISIIYQELSILPHLSIAENIFLGRLPKRKRYPWLIDWSRCYEESKELLNRLGLKVDPRTPASRLKVAEQQMVEIAKSLSYNAKVIIMDEPTAPLTSHEIDNLFEVVNMLKKQGVSIIYVSHRLPEIKEICDRTTVLRDGQNIGTVNVAETEIEDWVSMMVGRDLDKMFPKHIVPHGSETLEVRNLVTDKLKDVSFKAYKGEILGIAGLVGAGRTELARALFGADPILKGEINIAGKPVNMCSPRTAIKNGIGLVPEDRKGQGLVLPMSVKDNTTLANLPGISRLGKLRLGLEGALAKKFVRELDIATPGIYQETVNLSGGNQQKVVLAKWLCSKSQILIIDEPTRGIDVGAKVEIYELLNELVGNGATVIMISSEMPELIGMSDRVIVMHEGKITGELKREEFSEESIMRYASGLTDNANRNPMEVDVLGTAYQSVN